MKCLTCFIPTKKRTISSRFQGLVLWFVGFLSLSLSEIFRKVSFRLVKRNLQEAVTDAKMLSG